MSNHAFRARNGQDRASLYDEITDKIIAKLDAGRVPWAPWGTAAAKAQLGSLQAQLERKRTNRQRMPTITANLEQDHPVRPKLAATGVQGGGQ